MKLLYDYLIQFIVKYNKSDNKDKVEIIKDIILIENICNQYYPKDNYYRIALKHGVIYGKYLENAMEKRFAILEPTVRLKGPDVINGMKGLLNR